MNALSLPGCAPIPLAHYLKALGILRLVAEQADPEAAGCWERDVFVLHTRLDRAGLLDFFLHRYQPTPILAPWNGGSGFYAGETKQRLVQNRLRLSKAPRYGPYSIALAQSRILLAQNVKAFRATQSHQVAFRAAIWAARRSARQAVIAAAKRHLQTGKANKDTNLEGLLEHLRGIQILKHTLGGGNRVTQAELSAAWSNIRFGIRREIVQNVAASPEWKALLKSARRKALTKLFNDELAESKASFLLRCRNAFPETTLSWLDTACLLTDKGAKYPPLLGTGGNDGRLEFTNNFMQRLTEVLDPATGQPTAAAQPLLEAALFGASGAVPLSRAPVGQFLPGQAGGANASTGFDAESLINPWDFILMLEGALLFAAAAVRRLESSEPGALAYPFCVRQAAAGYASAAAGDEPDARAEMWMPLWKRPTCLPELSAILAEGRAQVGARAARHGVDFARAVVSLGVDRGLSAFQRYGFQVRNGLAYFATPLGRFAVRRNARADLLSEADRWLDNFRRIAGPAAKQVPAAVARALRETEERILGLCQEGSPARLQAVLVALGQAEKALARSFAWTTGRNETPRQAKIGPLHGLSARWLREADDGSVEFRLAASLASITGQFKDPEGRPVWLPLRRHLEPVRPQGGAERHWFAWDDSPSNDMLWQEADFVAFLNAVFARRLLRATQAGLPGLPDRGLPAALDDVVAFLEKRTDEARLADLLWGLCLLDWTSVDWQQDVPWSELRSAVPPPVAPSLFSLLRLAFPRPAECRGPAGDFPEVPLVPAIHRLAAAGNGLEASRLARRRLRASDLPPAVEQVAVSGGAARRTAAALLFPLSPRDFARLAELVLKPQTANA